MKNRLRLAVLTLLVLFATVLTDLPRPMAQTFRPVARGRRGVVAGGHPLSLEGGLRVRPRGGDALHARVATFFAASVIGVFRFFFRGAGPHFIQNCGTWTVPRKAAM